MTPVFLREAASVPLVLARQYGSVRGLRQRQLRELNAVLAHAVRSVPFYRDRSAYHRGPLQSLAELGELPLVTKAQLRELPQAMFVAEGTDPQRCYRVTTSGTTGHRIEILHNLDNRSYEIAAMVRRYLATGRYLPTHRTVKIRPYLVPGRTYQRFGLFRQLSVISSTPVEQWRAILREHRPRVLIGYPIHLRELLRVMPEPELATLRRRLRMVMTESELLIDAHRDALASGYGVPVFDEYSTFETLHIYFECARGGRHIAEDRVFVEVLDEDGRPVPDGTEGEIVCTAFHERAMPLLRYRLGDIGQINPDPCRCGRRFRTMRLTHGRIYDHVVLPDGRRIFADRFLMVAHNQPGVSELFARQDAAGTVRVHVVPDGTVPVPDLLAQIRKVLESDAGGAFPLEVLTADRIPLSPGGKGKLVQSDYPAATHYRGQPG